MSKLNVPLAELTPGDEPSPETFTIVPRRLPRPVNYATDPKTLAFIQRELVPVLTEARQSRRPMEDSWSAIRRMEQLVHDEGRRYLGRSANYLPAYKRVHSTITGNLSRGLFPSNDYLDVADRSGAEGQAQRAEKVKSYLQWEFDNVAQVRRYIKPFLRQMVHFGTSVLKHRYEKKTVFQGRAKFSAGIEGLMSQPGFYASCIEGLRVNAVNLFYWHVYPFTASNLDEAVAVFEDLDVPLQYVEEMKERGLWVNTDQAMNAPEISEHQERRANLLYDQGTTPPDASTVQGGKVGDVRTITEVWTYMPLPTSAYVDGERPGMPIPARVVMAGEVPVRVTRNPNFHQRPPYEVGRTDTTPGSFYGLGTGHVARHLQYLANDMANQTNDCGIYGLNPVAFINPAYLAGPLKPLSPGVPIYTTSVTEGVKFDRPPIEQVQYGMMMLQLYLGLLQDFGGAPAILQGNNAKGAAKTATGAQILQNNVGNVLQDVVEDLEADVMVPLMRAAWFNAQQFRTDPVWVRVAGMSLQVSPQDLEIDPDFQWSASSQAVNRSQRAQQLMGLAQALPVMAQLLAPWGKALDPEPLLRRIAVDGLGFRGFEEMVKPMPMPMMPPGGAPQPGAEQPEGDRVRSAVEQGGGEQGQMAPGEGNEFMDVRENADQMAGLIGSTYGGMDE